MKSMINMKFLPHNTVSGVYVNQDTHSLFILTNTGETREVTGLTDWSEVLGYCIVPKESPLAPGHNPDKLTTQQVGEGWRLLDGDEIKDRDYTKLIELFDYTTWRIGCFGSAQWNTYRTSLSREQLRLLDEGWTPWFGEGEPPTGRVEYVLRNGTHFSADSNALQWREIGVDFTIIAYRSVKKEKKIVPWDRSTCPPLPFEVVAKGASDRFVVIAAFQRNVCIAPWTHLEWEYFKENFTLPNGSPCGQEVEE